MKKRLLLFLIMIPYQLISFGQCDHTLTPSNNPSVTYKARGNSRNRCEGLYTAKVGSKSLDLVSFTIGTFSYKLEQTETIEIKNFMAAPIFIRSSAIPIGTYYRMDATLAGNETLKWEVNDVLYELKIPSKYLGIYGWLGTGDKTTYLPVKPVSSASGEADRKLYLVVRARTNIKEIKYRYTLSKQHSADYIDINISRRTGQSVVIVLPENLKGEYNFEIAVMLESENKWDKGDYKLLIQ